MLDERFFLSDRTRRPAQVRSGASLLFRVNGTIYAAAATLKTTLAGHCIYNWKCAFASRSPLLALDIFHTSNARQVFER